MFDVGFSELVLIAVVALVVIGPERLPKVARTLGALVGRMRNYVATVKGEVKREMQLEDLKKLQQEIHPQQIHSLESQKSTLSVQAKADEKVAKRVTRSSKRTKPIP